MNLLIIALAVYGLVTAEHLIRKIMCLAILENMVILAFLGVGRAQGARAPLLGYGAEGGLVDPMPQALMLTAIVIGVCFNALALAVVVRVHRHTGCLNASEWNE